MPTVLSTIAISLPAEYLDLISGQHETDTILDAMLDEKSFEMHLNDPYRMLRKGIIKLFGVHDVVCGRNTAV